MKLPQRLVGAYTHFNADLRRRYGFMISTTKYLRLTLEAEGMPGRPAKGERVWVDLLINGHRVKCLYDPTGGQGGALIACLWQQPDIPRPGSQREDKMRRRGSDKLRKNKASKQERRLRAYKRPSPGRNE